MVLTQSNWDTPKTVTVEAWDDDVVEGTHTSSINFDVFSVDSGYNNISVAGVPNVTITGNDSATVSFNPASVSQSEASTPMAFTVTLSNPVASGVSLSVNSTNGTATAADFTVISGGTVNFPANSTTPQTVNLTVNNDALDEDDESFALTLSNPMATGTVTIETASANGTILDNEGLPTLSVANVSQLEGNASNLLTFRVNLNPVSGRSVSFTRATAAGTAVSTFQNADFVALTAAPVTIMPGQTGVDIQVTINGDTVFEDDENFSLNLTAVDNATPGSLSATGTLEDDDQQSTTTTITADLPDPSVVGEPHPVTVEVRAQTLSPLGTVNISDGAGASCGPITLTAGTAPTSTASCNLTGTSAGNKNLTAMYTPASAAFTASSGAAAHTVNAAATTLSLSGPSRVRINQPASFSFALAVIAPGAGTPTGTVTLSSGAASCSATLPATRCNLTFTTLGSRTLTASYASDGNFSSSSSSGAGTAQTLVYALVDVSISKTNGVGYFEPGDLLVYSVVVRNLGQDSAANVRVLDIVPPGLVNAVWSCDASGGGACPVPGGAGNIDVGLASTPVGTLLNFTMHGNVAGSPLKIANTASIELPVDTTVEDSSQGNNSATDTDLIDFTFRDGFEDPPISAPAGSLRIPSLQLAGSLDDNAQLIYRLHDAQGEALRLYARLHGDHIQYALATRSNGVLRLGAWTPLPGEPTLSWTARAWGTLWLLESAQLR